MTSEIMDCTIIGGGPAGLYAAFYAGMRDLSARIVEDQAQLGGKLHFYPEKLIWDIGGVVPSTGYDVMNQMIEQGQTFNPEVNVNERIVKIEKLEPHLFECTSATGNKYLSKTVIVATGGGIVYPKRLPIEGIEHFEQTNLHYTIYRLDDFIDKKVAIVGGGNSAIDWANELKDKVKELHLIHRKGQFKAHEAQINELLESDIHIHTHSTVEELMPDSHDESIKAIKLKNEQTGRMETLPIDDLIVNIGFEAHDNFHQNSPLNFELIDNYYIKGTSEAQTSIEGIYAIGDIVDFNGKVRLIAGAYSDAVNAINQIRQHCYPLIQDSIVLSTFHEGLKQRRKG
ncbi:NAD(P)/FAD-dependent oxidoreductase [Alkalibacterium iburiense]|uniref:Ferredoxin--NADP reductase n=1 Tax=Alkalibacterium iburiense TaxID=290589 RepID=A0ABP3HFE9_9LACT